MDPTAPNLNPIPSNPVETTVGPELAVVKTQSPMGPVGVGDSIVYMLTVSNESPVDAHAVSVTDAVPANTTYVSCAGGCRAAWPPEW